MKMDRRKYDDDYQPSLEANLNGEMSEESATLFENYAIDRQALKIQWGLLSIQEIQDIDLSHEELSSVLFSQIDVRDTFIESLVEKINDLLVKGHELEADNKYLKQKVQDLRNGENERATNYVGYPNYDEEINPFNWNTEREIVSASDANQSGDKASELTLVKSKDENDELPVSDILPSLSQETRTSGRKEGSVENPSDESKSDKYKSFFAKVMKAVTKSDDKDRQSDLQDSSKEKGRESSGKDGNGKNSTMDTGEIGTPKAVLSMPLNATGDSDTVSSRKESDSFSASINEKETETREKYSGRKSFSDSDEEDTGNAMVVKKSAKIGDEEKEPSPDGCKESRRLSLSSKLHAPSKHESESDKKDTNLKNLPGNDKDKFKAMVAMAFKAHGFSGFVVPDKKPISSDDKGKQSGPEVGWSVKEGQTITDQVEATASESVNTSGYVYQEETGLYYDYSSGYYYNAENSLYYDPKTGTYFYYDHQAQSYQFHSQIPVDAIPAASKDAQDIPVDAIPAAYNENQEQKNVDADWDDELGNIYTSSINYSKEDLSAQLSKEKLNVPPSLRLMVTESGAEKVSVGELHIVTINGGRLGWKASNLVQLLDVNVGKEHAEFTYRSSGQDDYHYFLKDLGSSSGTYINGTCICIPGEPSDEIEIGHGWELQFGSVKLKCHIHPGYESCNECEPGLVLANIQAKSDQESSDNYKFVKPNLEKSRVKILKAMKKKYDIHTHVSPLISYSYEDRSKKRRTEKGSDNPYEKTDVASSEMPIKETNKGFGMLQKMGWSKGQGLGKSHPGITEPIEASSAIGREGLGFEARLPPTTQTQTKRKKILDVTVKRFKKL